MSADQALASSETRESLARAREAFRRRLGVLGWSEQDLEARIVASREASERSAQSRYRPPPDED